MATFALAVPTILIFSCMHFNNQKYFKQKFENFFVMFRRAAARLPLSEPRTDDDGTCGWYWYTSRQCSARVRLWHEASQPVVSSHVTCVLQFSLIAIILQTWSSSSSCPLQWRSSGQGQVHGLATILSSKTGSGRNFYNNFLVKYQILFYEKDLSFIINVF